MKFVTPGYLICLLDLAAAFAIICLMLETTKSATMRAFIMGDSDGRWAMIRRLVYAIVAIALFAKSVYIWEGRILVTVPDAIIWTTILFAIFIFPTLRAFGLINQDRWVGPHHRDRDHA